MARQYRYKEEVFELDDSQGCYVKVSYKDKVGYLGVNLRSGTQDNPYAWWSNPSTSVITKDGLLGGNVNGGGLEDNLNALCTQVLAEYRQGEAHRALQPEVACQSLHNFLKTLPN